MGGWLGPEVGYRTGDFEVAVAVSPGFNSFNSSLTFESQGYGDVYMEFDGQEIWFDEDGEASGSLSKSSFVVRPEVSVAYRFSEMFGLRGMAAYDIGFGGDSAWKLDARENGDDGASATVEYEGKYVPLSASELPEVIDFSGPTVMLLAEFNWGV